MKKLPSIVALLAAASVLQAAASSQPIATPPPDARYKADILVIVAHPDDETMATGYFAKAIFDLHKRVAVVFGTRGNGGGNAQGMEQAAALGSVREIEARRALASFGVMNVWFLGGPDTPGQDVLRSLETWNHGNALWQAVRIVRLTRPQIIVTWLPLYSAGENHGDHQAAGVIATEAFDMAGDPTVFPEQIAPPRDRDNIGNLTEGLRPWQPEKLYYFSDASHTEFLEGKGPKYATDGVSPSKGKPYYRLAAEEMSEHLTQSDTGQLAREALAKGDFKYFQDPVRFVFGKSAVPSSPTADLFEGTVPGPIPFAPSPGYRPAPREGITAELGGPWAFYRRFWQAHGLDSLANLLTPEVAVGPGSVLSLPILIHNDTGDLRDVPITVTLPSSWSTLRGPGLYRIDARDTAPVELFLSVPNEKDPAWQTVTVTIHPPGAPALPIPLRVNLASGTLPQ